jgi:hypothetical protein
MRPLEIGFGLDHLPGLLGGVPHGALLLDGIPLLLDGSYMVLGD